MAISAVFFDVGGVLLTNGWDRDCRLRVIDRFGLDWNEFSDRHDFVAQYFETGQLTLEEYLHRTVFHRDRDFTPTELFDAMKEASRELPGSLDVVRELHATDVFLATLNNESRELNEHRIETFELRRWFQVFFSSCYLGVKKPERPIYRMAVELTQRRPADVLFIDDRELNVECAADLGMDTIHFSTVSHLRDELSQRGLLP